MSFSKRNLIKILVSRYYTNIRRQRTLLRDSITSAYSDCFNGLQPYHLKYAYDPHIEFKVYCSLGFVSTISFEKGEFITKTNKIDLDPVLNITEVKVGSRDNIIQKINLKPKHILKEDILNSGDDGVNNFIVSTNKRVYRFIITIVSASQKRHEDVSFYYLNDDAIMINNRFKSLC
uniref:Uncharacterized protein n=1 Tax=Francisella tularensis subsp. novicida PA10-7858 TaxID=1386968 RepID=V5T8X5_FRANO|nr:TrbG/VirB9 family P-type conjugative transfer protein [Francisella tularensis]AHB60820.1 hypothetical protein N894_0052 [Francisella tularensis subsp. novicida PA10-7858]